MPDGDSSPYRVTQAQYTAHLSIKQDAGERCFGVVRRNGKEHFRNYARPIKNGLTLLDILRVRIQEAHDKMLSEL